MGWLNFDSVATPIVLYELALVVAFFVFIVTKSVIAVSTDAKRRLRLLYWGAAIGMTPLTLLGAVKI